MTTLARLLAQRRQLIARLDQDPGGQQRGEIKRLLERINATLDPLHEAGPGTRKPA